MSSSSTVSIVKTFSDIVDKKINETNEKSSPKVVLYKAGSSLTPTNLGTLSY